MFDEKSKQTFTAFSYVVNQVRCYPARCRLRYLKSLNYADEEKKRKMLHLTIVFQVECT